MTESQAKAILAGLGENRDEGVGGEVLELIYVEVEVLAALFWSVGAAEGRQLEFGDEDGPEKVGLVFAQLALG